MNPKGETHRNINEPYKKRIINDYGYNNESNKDKIKKVNINLKFSKKIEDLLSQNNNSDNNIKKDNIKYNYTTLNFNRIKNKNNTKEKIYKKTNLNSVCKKLSFKSNNEFLIKTEKFIQHLSKYCMLYYFQILKIFFSSLNHFNKYNNSRNEKYFSKSNTSNINRKIPVPSLHFNNRSTYERTINKLKGKTPSNKSCSLIVDRIRSKNESISPNKRNTCEMYRNVDELSKKCEMISNRKNRLNNSSLRKSIKNASFNNGKKFVNEFRFSSVEKNREKMEIAINKERERKKKISQTKDQKQNNNIEIKNNKNNENEVISKLMEKNKMLENKIKYLENKNKKIELNFKLDEITIKSIGKKDENNNISSKNNNGNFKNVFTFGKRRSSLNNDINKKNYKNNIIKVKNIVTKDKSIHINICYYNMQPIKNKNKTQIKIYETCNIFNIALFGNLNEYIKDENNDKDKSKYNALTSINEEENKKDF